MINDFTLKEIAAINRFFQYANPKITLGTKLQQMIDEIQTGICDMGTIPLTNRLYVDGHRTDTYIEDGSLIYPYKTINAVLTSITTNSDTNRFIVRINPGTYQEQIITKKFVYLVGDFVDSVKITYTTDHTIIVPDEQGCAGGFKNITIENLSNNSEINTVHCNVNGSVSFEDSSVISVAGRTALISSGAFLVTHNTSFQSAENDGIVCLNGGYLALDGGVQSGKDETTWDVSVESGGWATFSSATSFYNKRLNTSGDIDLRTPVMIQELTPVNAVDANGILTLTGVTKDGETVTIGDNIYEFTADVEKSVVEGNIAVDINAVTTKAQGSLTVDTQPTSGDTMTIGNKVYTFVPSGTANGEGEVSIGIDLAEAKTNIIAAINGTDGYNTANSSVSASVFVSNICILTAFFGGTAGNSIISTETFTTGTNIFDAGTLGTTTPGVDCTAPNAVTALVTEITNHGTELLSAADGVGDTVLLTANVKGTLANSISTTETMLNGGFTNTTLTGGIDGTVGNVGDIKRDTSYIYLCIAKNTVADTNWRRLALGSVY